MDLKIESFVKKKDYLICIDSDGTAMDSMTTKHMKCFGPSFVNEWNLTVYKDVVLSAWNEISLYSKARGKNRFWGLYDILTKFNGVYFEIDDLSVMKNWIYNAKELCSASLVAEIAKTNSETLKKALHWSEMTNKAIKELTFNDKKPFVGAFEFLREASKYADIVVVSSAEYEVVHDEWAHFNMLEFVGAIVGQEAGSKKSCIKKLIDKGYEKQRVMKIGDSMTDLAAAASNKVFFYPIVSGCEYKGWVELTNNFFKQFLSGGYKECQTQLVNGFVNSFY